MKIDERIEDNEVKRLIFLRNAPDRQWLTPDVIWVEDNRRGVGKGADDCDDVLKELGSLSLQ